MRLTLELILAICTTLTASRAETTSSTPQANPAEACKLYNNNTAVLCEQTKFKVDEAAPFSHPVKEVYFEQIKGSIGVKTLSSFQDAELLLIRMSDIDHFEEGALCSLPKLKRLVIEYSSTPPLTKKILIGCNNIEDFSTDNRIVEENALHDMTNLKKLTLSDVRFYSFSKAYIEPLNKLEYLSVSGADGSVKIRQVEPGMFCTSPNLKTLKVFIDLSVPLRDTLFENCDSVKSVHITVYGSIPDGENPVHNIPHLEELYLSRPRINRLTKSFIDAVPNLKILFVRCSSIDADAFLDAIYLKALSIGHMDVSDLKPIGKAVNLEVLTLRGFIDIEKIPELKNLRRLDLSYTRIRRLDLPALKQKFPNLKEINMDNNQLDPDFKEEIKKHPELKITNTYHDIDPWFGGNPYRHKTADGEPLIPDVPN